MTIENKIDPFKPAAPAIPGVESAPAQKTNPVEAIAPVAPGAPPQKLPESQGPSARLIGMAVAGGLLLLVIIGGVVLWRTASRAAAQMPKAPVTSDEDLPATAAPAASSEPVGPGPIATVSELAKPWASQRFLFPDSFTRQMTPSMVVHLPNGSYWGFSLKEPFGNCELEFVTDLKKLKSEYGFAAQHPMVADPCNQAVFDLMQYGNGAANDALVRGLPVQGSAIRPPIAIEIKVDGQDVVAARME